MRAAMGVGEEGWARALRRLTTRVARVVLPGWGVSWGRWEWLLGGGKWCCENGSNGGGIEERKLDIKEIILYRERESTDLTLEFQQCRLKAYDLEGEIEISLFYKFC
jgi:hypothetical protein